MRRRVFLGNMAAGTCAFSNALAMGRRHGEPKPAAHPESGTTITSLAGMSLPELRDFHIREIEQEYLPFWDDRRIDRQYGGVRPFLNPDGTYRSSNKRMYYLGRAIWVFSYLYDHFGRRKEHLETAEQTIDFIYRHGRGSRGYWNSEFTREGKVVQGPVDIYGDIYVVLGLGEYYNATGNEKARDIAIETAHGITERIVSPGFSHTPFRWLGVLSEEPPGTKRLGTWQHFLSALTPLARYTNDYGLQMMARMCVNNIVNRHWQTDTGDLLEQLDDRFDPYSVDSSSNNRFISGWHSIQAAWMVMDDMLRTGDRNTFMRAMEIGRQNLEKCWVDNDENGESGLGDRIDPEAKAVLPSTGSPWGSIDEALVFALLTVEHTHAQWAVDWFDRIFNLSYSHPERQARICLLHHPRRLFFVAQTMERMIARQGRVSDFLKGV